MAFQISIHRRQSDIDLIYHEPIILHRKYKVALQTFVTYNSIPDVSQTLNNNTLNIYLETWPVPKDLITVIIPDGTYKVADLIDLIMNNPLSNEVQLSLALNKNTMKVQITFKKGMTDFTQEGSVAPLLGFSNTRKIFPDELDEEDEGPIHSDMLVDINPINTIRVHCNLVKGNIHDLDRNDHTVYEFPLNVEPGERIVKRPSNLLYYGINTDEIHELTIRITDQSGNLIDFRGERVTLILLFHPVQL